MIEARIFIDSLEDAKTILHAQGAIEKGAYEITDNIFARKDGSVSLGDEFLRLRIVPKNIWDDKSVILAVKKTKLQAIGKNSDIPLKLQFDIKEDAELYYKEHLSSKYVKSFTFSRIGWQNILPNGDVVDLEIIEDKYPSIEFKSETDEGIKKLLSLFNVPSDKIIKGPSVVAAKELLKQ